MDIGTLGDVGDFLGGVGVLITLVYLAVQIRQNTATTRVQTVQQILNSSFLANIQHAASGRVPHVLQRVEAGARLDEGELGVYIFFVQGILSQQLLFFYQHQNGMVEKSLFEAFGQRNRLVFQGGLFRSIWNGRLRDGYPAEFQAYVDQFLMVE